MNPIWLEVIAHDDTLERFSYIVTSFYLTNEKKDWAVVVGNYGEVETYNFGEDEAKARALYTELCKRRQNGGLITFDEKTGTIIQ